MNKRQEGNTEPVIDEAASVPHHGSLPASPPLHFQSPYFNSGEPGSETANSGEPLPPDSKTANLHSGENGKYLQGGYLKNKNLGVAADGSYTKKLFEVNAPSEKRQSHLQFTAGNAPNKKTAVEATSVPDTESVPVVDDVPVDISTKSVEETLVKSAPKKVSSFITRFKRDISERAAGPEDNTDDRARQIESNIENEDAGDRLKELVDDEVGPAISRSAADNSPASNSLLDRALASTSKEDGISVFGLRVEKHSKALELNDAGVYELLVDSPALIRLFGVGLTNQTEILFTAEPGSRGSACTVKTSAAFKVRCHF